VDVIETFCGAGGLGTGIVAAGHNVVMANDFNQSAAYSYKLNHRETDVRIEPIQGICFKQYDGIDLFTTSPPCQGFSTAGKKESGDPKNQLFEQSLRAIKECRPRHIIFENVSGFMNLYGGFAYTKLLAQLRMMGYKTDFGIMDFSDVGLPQARKRFILLASMNGQPYFPYRTHEFRKQTLRSAIDDLVLGCDKLHYDVVRGLDTQARINAVKIGQSMKDLPLELQTIGFPTCYKRMYPDRPSQTIIGNFICASGLIHYRENRQLTLREGARLQSFPDDYEFCGTRGEIALQIGNAIPPMIGKLLTENLI